MRPESVPASNAPASGPVSGRAKAFAMDARQNGNRGGELTGCLLRVDFQQVEIAPESGKRLISLDADNVVSRKKNVT